MLEVKNIGAELREAEESFMRFETPATCGSKDIREILKSTCHWLSAQVSVNFTIIYPIGVELVLTDDYRGFFEQGTIDFC